MAGSKSDYLENELLDHVFKTGAYTQPTHVYVALLTSAPDDSSDGSDIAAIEADYTSYDRVACDSWDAAASGATENTGAVNFPASTGGSSVVTHFALLDGNAKTDADHCLYWGELAASRTISSGDTPSFAAGDIDITED